MNISLDEKENQNNQSLVTVENLGAYKPHKQYASKKKLVLKSPLIRSGLSQQRNRMNSSMMSLPTTPSIDTSLDDIDSEIDSRSPSISTTSTLSPSTEITPVVKRLDYSDDGRRDAADDLDSLPALKEAFSLHADVPNWMNQKLKAVERKWQRMLDEERNQATKIKKAALTELIRWHERQQALSLKAARRKAEEDKATALARLARVYESEKSQYAMQIAAQARKQVEAKYKTETDIVVSKIKEKCADEKANALRTLATVMEHEHCGEVSQLEEKWRRKMSMGRKETVALVARETALMQAALDAKHQRAKEQADYQWERKLSFVTKETREIALKKAAAQKQLQDKLQLLQGPPKQEQQQWERKLSLVTKETREVALKKAAAQKELMEKMQQQKEKRKEQHLERRLSMVAHETREVAIRKAAAQKELQDKIKMRERRSKEEAKQRADEQWQRKLSFVAKETREIALKKAATHKELQDRVKRQEEEQRLQQYRLASQQALDLANERWQRKLSFVTKETREIALKKAAAQKDLMIKVVQQQKWAEAECKIATVRKEVESKWKVKLKQEKREVALSTKEQLKEQFELEKKRAIHDALRRAKNESKLELEKRLLEEKSARRLSCAHKLHRLSKQAAEEQQTAISELSLIMEREKHEATEATREHVETLWRKRLSITKKEAMEAAMQQANDEKEKLMKMAIEKAKALVDEEWKSKLQMQEAKTKRRSLARFKLKNIKIVAGDLRGKVTNYREYVVTATVGLAPINTGCSMSSLASDPQQAQWRSQRTIRYSQARKICKTRLEEKAKMVGLLPAFQELIASFPPKYSYKSSTRKTAEARASMIQAYVIKGIEICDQLLDGYELGFNDQSRLHDVLSLMDLFLIDFLGVHR